MRIRFGPVVTSTAQNRLLSRAGPEIPLPPRVLGVLEVLLERAGEVVARQDLLDQVWKDAFVTDTSLAEAVSFLGRGSATIRRPPLHSDRSSSRLPLPLHRPRTPQGTGTVITGANCTAPLWPCRGT